MSDTRVSGMISHALHEVDPDESCSILQDAYGLALELEQQVSELEALRQELAGDAPPLVIARQRCEMWIEEYGKRRELEQQVKRLQAAVEACEMYVRRRDAHYDERFQDIAVLEDFNLNMREKLDAARKPVSQEPK